MADERNTEHTIASVKSDLYRYSSEGVHAGT